MNYRTALGGAHTSTTVADVAKLLLNKRAVGPRAIMVRLKQFTRVHPCWTRHYAFQEHS